MRPRLTVLIAGVTGQDGAYLAHDLLGLVGYRLERLGIKADVQLLSLAPNDFRCAPLCQER